MYGDELVRHPVFCVRSAVRSGIRFIDKIPFNKITVREMLGPTVRRGEKGGRIRLASGSAALRTPIVVAGGLRHATCAFHRNFEI